MSADPAARRDAERALARDVINWYIEDAKTRQQQRALHSPSERDVLPIARLVVEFRRRHQQTVDEQRTNLQGEQANWAKVGQFHEALHRLLAVGPTVMDLYLRGGGPTCPEAWALAMLITDMDVASKRLHLDLPPPTTRRGAPPRDLTAVWARALLPHVDAVWRAAGWHDELSAQTPTGPVITIVCQALEAIDGREHQPAQVLSALERQNPKKQRKGRP